MTVFTGTNSSIMMCDNCKRDLHRGDSAFMLSPGKVSENETYISRDYALGVIILCSACSSVVGQIMNLMGMKRADSLTLIQEAA